MQYSNQRYCCTSLHPVYLAERIAGEYMGGTSPYGKVYLFKLSLYLLVTMLHHKEGYIRYKLAVGKDIYHVPGK